MKQIITVPNCSTYQHSIAGVKTKSAVSCVPVEKKGERERRKKKQRRLRLTAALPF